MQESEATRKARGDGAQRIPQEEALGPVLQNPLTPAGWTQYLPSAAADPVPAMRVTARRIVLLQSDEESGAAISAEHLVAFQRAVTEKVREAFGDGLDHGQLYVTSRLDPAAEAGYELQYQGPLAEASLQRVWDNLKKLVPPGVARRFAFAVEFQIAERS